MVALANRKTRFTPMRLASEMRMRKKPRAMNTMGTAIASEYRPRVIMPENQEVMPAYTSSGYKTAPPMHDRHAEDSPKPTRNESRARIPRPAALRAWPRIRSALSPPESLATGPFP